MTINKIMSDATRLSPEYYGYDLYVGTRESPRKQLVNIPHRCSMCGETMDEWDAQENRAFRDRIGYGSKYDNDNLDIRWCCNCFDLLIDLTAAMRSGYYRNRERNPFSDMPPPSSIKQAAINYGILKEN